MLAQDFAVHVIHVVGNGIAIFLLYVLHALTLGEKTADNAVGAFVGATLDVSCRKAFPTTLTFTFSRLLAGGRDGGELHGIAPVVKLDDGITGDGIWAKGYREESRETDRAAKPSTPRAWPR